MLRFLNKLRNGFVAVVVFLIFKPAFSIGRVFLKLTLPLYRLLFNVRHRATVSQNGVRHRSLLESLTNNYLIHVAVVLLTVGVALGSLTARGAGLADVTSNSVLGKVISRENPEEEDIIERAAAPRVAYLPRRNALSPEANLEAEIGAVVEPEQAVAASGNALQIPVLNESGVQQRSDVTTYVVQPGDTVGGIANRFGITQKTILAANNLSNADFVKLGQELLIPPITGVLHRVVKGDTVASLAQKYKVDSQDILDFNRLADPSSIATDQTLIIPGAEIPDIVPERPATQPTRRGLFAGPVPGPAPAITGGKLNWPTSGRRITQYFRWGHTGIDVDCGRADPLYVARDGTVTAVVYQRWGYGYHIIVNNGGGLQTLYGHASKIFVKPGQRVSRGQSIGICGSTGRSTGTHVHFETIVNGRKVNPLTYL